ncbi:MAG: DNA polymerase III subunit epsilon [Propionibacterium sp.]|nr:DNA polymerase III subunit epsilon [Propionibacterium sp.]
MSIFRKRHNRLRTDYLSRAPEGPVHDYLAEPFPALDTPLRELPMLAVDLETTGLDPAVDRIVSIGFIPVDGHSIPIAGGRELLVRPKTVEGVGHSATVHGLTDDQVAAGLPLTEALTQTLAALRGRVLLAHHAAIEIRFLSRACQNVFGAKPLFAAVDTLALGSDFLMQGDDDIPRGRLRLSALRAQFGLPRYRAHLALTDALACAELYLALTAEMGQRTLKQVIVR